MIDCDFVEVIVKIQRLRQWEELIFDKKSIDQIFRLRNKNIEKTNAIKALKKEWNSKMLMFCQNKDTNALFGCRGGGVMDAERKLILQNIRSEPIKVMLDFNIENFRNFPFLGVILSFYEDVREVYREGRGREPHVDGIHQIS